jgi:hypothetical protein
VIAEPGRRIDDAKVDAEIVQALVHQARKHGGRPVEHVLARRAPEGFLADPTMAALGQRHLERVGDALAGEIVGFRRRLAPDAPEFLAHDRAILDPMPIGVDHGVAQARVKLPGFRLTVGLHGRASQKSGLNDAMREIVADPRNVRDWCPARALYAQRPGRSVVRSGIAFIQGLASPTGATHGICSLPTARS